MYLVLQFHISDSSYFVALNAFIVLIGMSVQTIVIMIVVDYSNELILLVEFRREVGVSEH